MTNASEDMAATPGPNINSLNYTLYFQNENFHGPNDLIFDRQGDLYCTDPWGTNMANLRGAVYYVSPEGKNQPTHRQWGDKRYSPGEIIGVKDKMAQMRLSCTTSIGAGWGRPPTQRGCTTVSRSYG